jgi:hypothetical protein
MPTPVSWALLHLVAARLIMGIRPTAHVMGGPSRGLAGVDDQHRYGRSPRSRPVRQQGLLDDARSILWRIKIIPFVTL